MHGAYNVKLANAQKAKGIYINTRTSRRGCISATQVFGITKPDD
jgi:hypothetical protein